MFFRTYFPALCKDRNVRDYLVERLNANILERVIEAESMLLLMGRGASEFRCGVIID